jgi:hypothetical protein
MICGNLSKEFVTNDDFFSFGKSIILNDAMCFLSKDVPCFLFHCFYELPVFKYIYYFQ